MEFLIFSSFQGNSSLYALNLVKVLLWISDVFDHFLIFAF